VEKNGQWKESKNKGNFLFPVKSISSVFRAKFVAQMREELPKQDKSLYDKLFSKQWVVYAKRPFGRPENIIEYLGRYSHKIAISNYRIRSINSQKKEVTFSLKDYRKNGKKTVLTLKTKEFIRRFCLHILPKGFTRIRHYGILSSSWKKEKLPALQQKMNCSANVNGVQKEISKKEKETFLNKCPSCKVGDLIPIVVFNNRGPPPKYAHLLKTNSMKSIN
jgi:hypothetical protein